MGQYSAHVALSTTDKMHPLFVFCADSGFFYLSCFPRIGNGGIVMNQQITAQQLNAAGHLTLVVVMPLIWLTNLGHH